MTSASDRRPSASGPADDARGRGMPRNAVCKWVERNRRNLSRLIRAVLVLLLVALILAGIVPLLQLLFISPDVSEDPSPLEVTTWLHEIPEHPELYRVMAGLAAAYALWHLYRHGRLRREFEEKGKEYDDLTGRDRKVVRVLRDRALALRTRADSILFGAVILLFASFYFLVFVAPDIPGLDLQAAERAAEETKRQAFARRFGPQLGSLDRGEFWLHVATVKTDTEARGIWRYLENERTGKHTTLAIGSDKALVTSDGTKWNEPKSLKLLLDSMADMMIEKVSFSRDGNYGVVGAGGRQHTGYFVAVTRDGGRTWTEEDALGLQRDGRLMVEFSPDGRLGVVGGDEGSVYVTRDGGESWSAERLGLNENERLMVVEFSPDGRFGVVGGDKGSVYVTRDGGESWSAERLGLNENERLMVVEFSPDGRFGVVGGDKGSVYVTRDGGESWSAERLGLKENERLMVVEFSPDGRFGVVGGDKGSVSVTRDDGESWSAEGLGLKENERLVVVEFSPDGRLGVVGGDEGSVSVTRDAGENWSKAEGAELNATEELAVVAFDAKELFAVVGGDEGSVFVTRDGGENWSVIQGDSGPIRLVFVAGRPIGSRASRDFFGMDDTGRIHLLKAFSGIGDLANKPVDEIQTEIRKFGIPPQSQLMKDVERFWRERRNNPVSPNEDRQQQKGSAATEGGIVALDQVDWIRITTLIIMFFLGVCRIRDSARVRDKDSLLYKASLSRIIYRANKM